MARTTTLPRITRRSIEAGMEIYLPERNQGVGFTVHSVAHLGEESEVVSRGTSVIYYLTNDDVIRVIPAEGEVWA
jgi:hypothetical protein